MFKNTRLIHIISELPTRERTKFKEFVSSPFFNKNKKIIALCNFIDKFAPRFDHEGFTKDAAYKKVFGKGKYQERPLLNIISELLQLLYSYLAYKNFESNGRQAQIAQLQELQKRELYPPFQNLCKKFRKQSEKIQVKDAPYFFEEYLFHCELDLEFHSKKSRYYDENLQKKNDYLDLYYLSSKLKIACDIKSRNNVIKADYQCHHLEDLIERIEESPDLYQQTPAIYIYYRIFQTLNEPDNEQHYRELKDLLAANIKTFDHLELRTMFDYLQNYCIKKINTGQSAYLREIFDSYKLTLETEIAFYKGYLSEWDYKNIVTASLRLGDFDWTKEFIEQYRHKLPKEVRENAYYYNLASYYYTIKDYRNALLQLLTIEFSDASYSLGAKTIQLKSYYELEEHEALLSHCDAFAVFIRRNSKIPEIRKNATRHLIRLTKSITILRQEKPYITSAKFHKKLANIQEQLQDTEAISNIDWLENIVQNLKIDKEDVGD